jgi:hypothetical protein
LGVQRNHGYWQYLLLSYGKIQFLFPLHLREEEEEEEDEEEEEEGKNKEEEEEKKEEEEEEEHKKKHSHCLQSIHSVLPILCLTHLPSKFPQFLVIPSIWNILLAFEVPFLRPN